MTFGEKLWKYVVMKDSDTKQIMTFMTKSKKSQVCIFLKLRICTVASWTISLWDYVSKLHRQIHPPKTGIEPTRWEAKWLRIGHYNPSANGAPDRIYIYSRFYTLCFAPRCLVLSNASSIRELLPANCITCRQIVFTNSHLLLLAWTHTVPETDEYFGGCLRRWSSREYPVKGTFDCFRNINFEMKSILPWYFNPLLHRLSLD